MPRPKRQISKRDLEAVFSSNPNVTQNELKDIFRCGGSTIVRELKRHGLRTRPWTERSHKESSKSKIGLAMRGRLVGEGNPNFGDKDRPWLEGDANPLRRWHQENPDFGDRQRGENNPIHQVRHLYEDPEYVARISRGLREHAEERRGSTYEEVYGEEKATEYKEKLRLASPARLSKFTRRETQPERIVREILESEGVTFEAEFPIGPYTVDFLVGSTVIQADGDYWHGNPALYDDSKLNDTQRRRRRLDASCDSFLTRRGYSVLRLWEQDLLSFPEKCRLTIMKSVGEKTWKTTA